MTDPTRTRRVLLVDDEEDLVWSLCRRLQRACTNAVFEGKTRPEDALDALRGTEYDLLITDIRMPNLSGVELLVEARKTWPALPFVVMTAYPTEFTRNEALRLGSVSYVEKPFELEALVQLVEEVFRRQEQSGFSGDVLLDTLPDLVQLFTLSQLTGALHLWLAHDRGSVWFDRGSITHAMTSSQEGTAAFYEIMTWVGGEFAMERNAVPPEVTIFENATGLIMEALRRLDESRRASASSGSAPAMTESAQQRRSWLPANPESERFATRPSDRPNPEAGTETAETPLQSLQEKIMSTNVQNALESLRNIDGYVGSCLVDSESGMCLGTDGGGNVINLEVAAANNTEVVRAKRKAIKALALRDEIEDMLITLGKQYHILRPMKNRPNVFFYVVVDRSRANLAMARITLSDVEKKLDL